MSQPPTPRLFLERRTYQRRRLIDALRLLPFLGLAIWLVPLVWPKPEAGAGGVSVVAASIYIFVGWAVICVLCAGLVARLSDVDDPARSEN